MDNENKKKTTIWLYPGTIRRMDGWLYDDNCASRSEFVEKALSFYMGYLATDDVSFYLCDALVATLRGTIEHNANRFRSLIFKLYVEVGMAVNVVAAHFKADRIDLRELRGYVVNQVKTTNGQVKFDDALELQRQIRIDDTEL